MKTIVCSESRVFMSTFYGNPSVRSRLFELTSGRYAIKPAIAPPITASAGTAGVALPLTSATSTAMTIPETKRSRLSGPRWASIAPNPKHIVVIRK